MKQIILLKKYMHFMDVRFINMSNYKEFLKIQAANIIFSLSSIVTKYVSVIWQRQGILNGKFALGVALYASLLGIYAVLWQFIMKKTELSVAYFCKGTVIFWSLLWSCLFFDEKITLFNLMGTAFIFIGITVVMKSE